MHDYLCLYNAITYSLILGVTILSGKYQYRTSNTGPVLSSISCTGSESHAKECMFGNVGTLNCGHDTDAVISCLNGNDGLHPCSD